MTFEGIVIHRVPYKDRDLIVKLLLRQGLVGSFYIYGGQGGGKNHKPSVFELGSMIKMSIREQRARVDSSDLMISSEYQRIWGPQNLRHEIRAYYLTCLYLELIQKFALPYHHSIMEGANQDQDGIFSVLSNALFYIEDSLSKQIFVPHQHLTLFIIKLLYHLGIMPDTHQCSYCQTQLIETETVVFQMLEGQFACQNCISGEDEKGLLLRIRLGYQTRFQDYEKMVGTNFLDCDKLLHYFCHQFQLKPVELKTYSLLFK